MKRPLPLSPAESKGGGARLAGGALPTADDGARGPHAHAARGRRTERRVRRARQVPVHLGGGVRARGGARALTRARLALRTHAAPLQSVPPSTERYLLTTSLVGCFRSRLNGLSKP